LDNIHGSYCPDRCTYQPEQCGVADYTAHLRDFLAQQGLETIVLTTQAATTDDPMILVAVQNWHLTDLMSLVQAVHASKADLLHSDLRDRLGQSAYQFSQQFAWSNIAIAHQEIYQMVLGEVKG
jgi:hypothetical protein